MARYTYHPSGLMNQVQYAYNPTTQTWRTLTSTWDADSNRVGMNANGTGYSFVYDTTAGIPAVIEESSGGAGVYYIREPGGELIARVHPSQGIRYYHFDVLGSTRLLSDASGTVTDRYAYDAYGALLAHDRLTGSVYQPYQYVGRLGYYTHYQEPEFGLLQLGVRFYDAETGRFAQRDPAQEGLSDFAYGDGNAVRLVDPSGLNADVWPFPRIRLPRLPRIRLPSLPKMPALPRVGAVGSLLCALRGDPRVGKCSDNYEACHEAVKRYTAWLADLYPGNDARIRELTGKAAAACDSCQERCRDQRHYVPRNADPWPWDDASCRYDEWTPRYRRGGRALRPRRPELER